MKPDPDVHRRALFAPLQLGIANAVGLALDPVAFAITVLAEIAAMPLTPMPPHAGEVDEPVETITWPADEPVGLSRDGGTIVVANAMCWTSARSAIGKIFFISYVAF
ncbi:hypothetical protein KEH56_24290 [Burkholderia cenocepacia]|uniref:hypothetical protein n=1 Tax=Burkholderia cenocepacia TaxID=95486 RepID=UPI001BA6ECA0|nr:hypothetical protein [Burkholderia cenocepacia]QUN42425.1 hypothetical protein KEH56_24290 [Burkholderia cenocepacia]QUO26175.1 hypothetical protein KEH57_04410 [Burkholderia cenocepacia]